VQKYLRVDFYRADRSQPSKGGAMHPAHPSGEDRNRGVRAFFSLLEAFVILRAVHLSVFVREL
jgi:hypothetical protein|tara:strand:+ start:722 stop:910 length:189 start_codon:yes stop_codon:yes gene_type:complete